MKIAPARRERLISTSLQLTNTGAVTDTIAVHSCQGNMWPVTLPVSLTLPAGEQFKAFHGGADPRGAADGAFDIARVLAISTGDRSQWAGDHPDHHRLFYGSQLTLDSPAQVACSREGSHLHPPAGQ